MVTEEKLVREFQAIGVQPGMTLEVHSSLSSFGFVEGGADTVIRALKTAVTEEGSLFLPALRLSRERPLTERDRSLGIERKIQILPPDCAHTAMGAVADTFRRQPDTCTGEGVFRISGWGKHGGEAARGGLQFALEHGERRCSLGWTSTRSPRCTMWRTCSRSGFSAFLRPVRRSWPCTRRKTG